MLRRRNLSALLMLLALPFAAYGFLVTDPCSSTWVSSVGAEGRKDRAVCGRNAHSSSSRFEARQYFRKMFRKLEPVLMTHESSNEHKTLDSRCASQVVFDPQKFGSTAEERRRASIPTSKACGIKLVLAGKVIRPPSRDPLSHFRCWHRSHHTINTCNDSIRQPAVCMTCPAQPCSGKGTQAPLISRKYRCVHISTGNLLRAEMRIGSELGRQVRCAATRRRRRPPPVLRPPALRVRVDHPTSPPSLLPPATAPPP
jgi:hypothetical protein